jgi:hypothetical protein
MSRARWIALCLASMLLTGCFTQRENRISRLRSNFTSTASDGIYLDYVVVERTAGDSYVDRKMWSEIDEMVIPVDSRPVARNNGFRIGVIGGIVSPEIQTLIANPKTQQGVRRRQYPLGQAKPLPIGSPVSVAEFAIRNPDEDEAKSFKLEQAQLQFQITPWEGDGGKLRLEFVPEVQHQDKKHWIPPGAVGAGWLRDKPNERFSNLGWEVNVSPSEYLIIGTSFQAEGTLGNRLMIGESGKQRVQRLLILRAGKVNQSMPLGDFFNEEGPIRPGSQVPPLALQASSSRPK